MTVNIRQVSAVIGSATPIGTAVPGATVILSVNDAAADVSWGTSSSVTAATGCLIQPSGPTVFTVPEECGTFDVYVISGTGTHATSMAVLSSG